MYIRVHPQVIPSSIIHRHFEDPPQRPLFPVADAGTKAWGIPPEILTLTVPSELTVAVLQLYRSTISVPDPYPASSETVYEPCAPELVNTVRTSEPFGPFLMAMVLSSW
jgi:hypothetical protein